MGIFIAVREKIIGEWFLGFNIHCRSDQSVSDDLRYSPVVFAHDVTRFDDLSKNILQQPNLIH